MSEKRDWIVIANVYAGTGRFKTLAGYEFRCTRCKVTYRPATPCPVNLFVAMGKAFADDHARCAA